MGDPPLDRMPVDPQEATPELRATPDSPSGSHFEAPRRLLGVTDKQPFEVVVADHGPTVLRVCRAMLRPSDADDAWSETFLSAMKGYPELPGDANVEAWLVTIAHRKAIDATRSSARRPIPMEELPAGPDADRADARDLDLTRSLAALPEKQRYAVVHHYLAGLPYKDVAAIIGGSADAARRAAADGVAQLRRAGMADTWKESSL